MSINLGNKSKYLKILSQNGFTVPPFVVLSASENINDWEKTLKPFLKFDKFYAVRSSALTEDGLKSSKAGFYYSAIAVPFDKILIEANNVARKQEKLGGIVVQEFIPTDKAGVMFSSNNRNQCIIEANMGLCTTVVGGENCDIYFVSKFGDPIYTNVIKNKNPQFFSVKGLYRKKTNTQVLSKKEIKLLFKVGKKIEKLFNYPQDIEWGFMNGKLFIFQSRSITVLPELNVPRIYDNANIAESYSGIVMPLTISFIKDMYFKVYCNLMRASGVTTKTIDKNKDYFYNLIAEYKGRVYYRMDSWFNMSALLPGFKRNQKNLKIMINSKHEQFFNPEVRTSNLLKIIYPFIAIIKIIILPFKINYFKYKIKKRLDYYYSLNWNEMSSDELISNLNLIKKEFIKPWHITIENDFLLMSWLGYIKKKQKEEHLYSSLAFISGNSEQLFQLKRISKMIMEDEDLEKNLNSLNTYSFLNELNKNLKIKKEIDIFLKKYYNRMANELKLEVPTLKANYNDFLELLILYKNVNLKAFTKNSNKKFNLANIALIWHAKKREECRLLRSQVFGLIKTIFLHLGEIYSKQGLILNYGDIYYLTVDEVIGKTNDLKKIIYKRRKKYDEYRKLDVPNYFIDNAENYKLLKNNNSKSLLLKGVPASKGKIRGRIKVCINFSLPKKIDFEILVAKHTDPGWNPLLGLIKGLIVEQGGLLSHAAITARELGLPAIISVIDATKNLHDGQLVELDADTGIIKIIK